MVQNPDPLRFRLGAITASPFGQELHPSLEEKACALAHAIIQGHVFRDGNKRTGLEVLMLTLELNGKALTADNDQIEETIESYAAGELEFEELVTWVEENSI